MLREILLIKLAGLDRRGLIASILSVLAEHKVDILDIGESVIHETLLMAILAKLPAGAEGEDVIKELLYRAHELELKLEFEPLSPDQYEEWVVGQGKPRWTITVLSSQLNSVQLEAVASIIARHGLNIDVITRLSGRRSLRGDEDQEARSCLEFWVCGQADDPDALRKDFMQAARDHEIDIAFQRDNVFRRNRRLVVFDMDSTLIQCEIIDELAHAAGVGDQVSAITEAAMRGEIDFKQSFTRRLGLLKGLDASAMEKIKQSLPITDGALRLISTLKMLGYRTAIISGGFKFVGELLQQKLGIDEVFAHDLEIENGKVTGRVCGEIIDGARKAELLRELATREGIRLEQTIAIGDGANDLPMLNLAGLGIAFHAKPVVRAGARHAISTHGLDGILYLLGMRDRDHIA